MVSVYAYQTQIKKLRDTYTMPYNKEIRDYLSETNRTHPHRKQLDRHQDDVTWEVLLNQCRSNDRCEQLQD